ncbi:phosphopyruvate hydratase, partial [Patescibacteria group bacterium]|nr:phosphopyruvate hydratase [Patescibacteria group bacterium]
KNVNQGLLNYEKLKKALLKEKIDTDVGLEGGFAPNNLNDYQAMQILRKSLPVQTKYAIDVGGSYFKQSEEYDLEDLIKDFKIISIEDPFAEKDIKKWQGFFKKFGKNHLVVGDDLVATNIFRLKKALFPLLINAVIVKPNQIGTVSETLEFVRLARKNKMKIIVSHRSGETNDPFIADLALAIGADFVKFGGMARGERLAKYNRLLQS